MAKNKLQDKLNTKYHSLQEFVETSGVPVSFEACRRTIYLQESVSAQTYAVICQYLGFSLEEIKQLLIEDGDTVLHHLIGSQTIHIEPDEMTIIKIIRCIRDKNPKILYFINDTLFLVCKAFNIKTPLLNRLRVHKHLK